MGFSEHVGRDLWGRSLDELFEAASCSKQCIFENHLRCPRRPAASCEDRSISAFIGLYNQPLLPDIVLRGLAAAVWEAVRSLNVYILFLSLLF